MFTGNMKALSSGKILLIGKINRLLLSFKKAKLNFAISYLTFQCMFINQVIVEKVIYLFCLKART